MVARSVALLSALLSVLALLAPKIKPSSTAEGVAFARYLLSDAGLLSEGISKAFFPVKAFLFTLHPRMRDKFISGLLPGGAAHLATRTWFYDGNFAKLLKPGMQVVICGAGFDSRAYRLHAPRGVRFFELDLAEHPGVQNYKMRQLQKHGIATEQVSHLPINFMTESIAEVLQRGGHDATKPTIFLWEGVTMYLSDAAVRATVSSMRSVAAPGSYLMCELFSAHLLTEAGKADPLLSPYWQIVTKSGEGYSFGVWPAEMPTFWREMGVTLIEHYTPEQQMDEWTSTPGTAAMSDGKPPHGGVCHLFLLQLVDLE